MVAVWVFCAIPQDQAAKHACCTVQITPKISTSEPASKPAINLGPKNASMISMYDYYAWLAAFFTHRNPRFVIDSWRADSSPY